MIELIQANSLLVPLADNSIHMVVTSPPYWSLRDYGIDGQLGLEQSPEEYVARMVERLRDAIVPDDAEGEPPLLPVLNRYKPIGTTAEVDFKTTRPCYMTGRSHVNQVVADTMAWEGSAAFRLEQSPAVTWYVRNDHLGLGVSYEYLGADHSYEPDFVVRLASDVTVVLEVKGFEDNQTKAKHDATKRWGMAVNNSGKWDAGCSMFAEIHCFLIRDWHSWTERSSCASTRPTSLAAIG